MIITSSKKLREDRAATLIAALPKNISNKPYIDDIHRAIMIQSKLDHYMRDADVNEILESLIPPMELGQYKMFVEDGKPVACVTWAFLDFISKQRWLVDGYDLAPDKWNSGEEIWLMDCFGEKGHGKRATQWLINHLRNTGHRGKYMYFIRAYGLTDQRESRVLL